ncbi:MAG: gluconokinase [Bacillota bacterium]
MQYLIGLDIGTTSTRAIMFDEMGRIHHRAGVEYETVYLPPNGAEQDPERIFGAVLESVASLMSGARVPKNKIAGIGISSAMYSLIPVGNSGAALFPMLIWADGRSSAVAKSLRETLDHNKLYQLTGCPLQPLYPLAKLRWLRECHPEIFNKAVKFISIKEYVLFRLFGEYLIDWSLASATGLFNIHSRCWEEEALRAAGIRLDQLSQTVPPSYVLRGIKEPYASKMGLAPDLPVVIGAGDGPLANLGAGCLSRGQVNIDIGTSGAIRMITSRPLLDALQRTWCYCLAEDYWVSGGIISNAGNVLRWLRDIVGDAETTIANRLRISPDEIFSQYAGQVPAGSDKLIFLPFLNGERNPCWNADARGVFVGLSFTHSKQHLVRSVLEGITYSIYSIYEVLDQLDHIEEIRLTGGFAQSDLWCRILASVFERSVSIPHVTEGSGLGAAIMAGKYLGLYSHWEDAAALIQIREKLQPEPVEVHIYRKMFAIYQNIYHQMEDQFLALRQLDDK